MVNPFGPAARCALSALTLLCAVPAHAGSKWDVPSTVLEMRAIHDSELFPGSALSTPDRGMELNGTIETTRRLSPKAKLSVGGAAGGQAWDRFSEAGYGWAGLHSTVRTGNTQLRADVEWTPQRLKFPAELEGGKFARLESRLGVRQALSPKLRLRVEGRHQTDDFVTAYDARDGSTNEGYGQLALRANDTFTLRADALVGRTRTTSRKYGHADRAVGGSLAASYGVWQFDTGVWSGLSRYRDAISGDSNFRRRDQWIQLRAEARRAIGGGITVIAGGEYTDQNSSRLDRSYTRTTAHLALAWTATGQ